MAQFLGAHAKSQRIQWFGQTMKREKTNEARVAIEYKPTGR